MPGPVVAPMPVAVAAVIAGAQVAGSAPRRRVRFRLTEDTEGGRAALASGESLDGLRAGLATADEAALAPDVLTTYLRLCASKGIPPIESLRKQLLVRTVACQSCGCRA